MIIQNADQNHNNSDNKIYYHTTCLICLVHVKSNGETLLFIVESRRRNIKYLLAFLAFLAFLVMLLISELTDSIKNIITLHV